MTSKRGACDYRVARYGVRLTFVGGKKPMMLAAYQTREQAKEFARAWCFEMLALRMLPEAADEVQVFQCSNGATVSALLLSHADLSPADRGLDAH